MWSQNGPSCPGYPRWYSFADTAAFILLIPSKNNMAIIHGKRVKRAGHRLLTAETTRLYTAKNVHALTGLLKSRLNRVYLAKLSLLSEFDLDLIETVRDVNKKTN